MNENAGGQGHMSVFLVSMASFHCASWTTTREAFAKTLRNDLQENEDSETKAREGEVLPAAPYHLSLRAEAVPGERTAHTNSFLVDPALPLLCNLIL